MNNTVRSYIDGDFATDDGKGTFPIFRPEDGGLSGMVLGTDFMDFVACTQSVVRNQDKWKKIPHYKKIDAFKKLVDGMSSNKEVFEKLLVIYLGYSTWGARKEVREALIAGQAALDEARERVKLGEEPKPYGLCLFFLPSSSPIYNFFLLVLPALLNGNQVLIRPHYQTSPIFDGLLQLYSKLDVTEAVLQVLYHQNFSEDLDMVEHPAVRFVYYAGDSISAKNFQLRAAENSKPIFWEAEGRNSVILGRGLDFAEHGEELFATLSSMHFLSNFRGSRVFIPDNCWDEYLKKLYELIEEQNEKLGSGVIWSREESRRCLKDVETLRAAGSQVRKFSSAPHEQVLRGELIVLEDVSNCEAMIQEAAYGSIVTLTRYKNIPEATKYANTTPWGLVTYIFAKDVEKAKTWAEGFQTGLVFINSSATKLHKYPLYRQGISGSESSETYMGLFCRKSTVVGEDVVPTPDVFSDIDPATLTLE